MAHPRNWAPTGATECEPDNESALGGTDVILTTKEVAAWLRIHPKTVRAWATSGKLPAFRVGGVYRFERHALVEKLDQWRLSGAPTPRTGTSGSSDAAARSLKLAARLTARRRKS